jgi:hypothetical protein
VNPGYNKTLMALKGYLPLPAKYKNYFYKEGIQKKPRRQISWIMKK